MAEPFLPRRRARPARDDEYEAMLRVDAVRLLSAAGYRQLDGRPAYGLRMGLGQASRDARGRLRTADDVVLRSLPSGVWLWTDNRGGSGTVIELVQRLHGGRAACSLGRVRQLLRAFLAGTAESWHPPAAYADGRSPHDPEAVQRKWASMAPIGGSSFLAGRGISPETTAAFGCDMRQDRAGRACLAHRGEDGAILGYEIKGENYSGYARGGRRTIGLLGPREKLRQVVVVEQAVKGLALAELEGLPEATVYTSTAGRPSEGGTLVALRALLAANTGACLVVALDADEAGDSMSGWLRVRLAEFRPQRLRPQGAVDWDALLRRGRGQR